MECSRSDDMKMFELFLEVSEQDYFNLMMSTNGEYDFNVKTDERTLAIADLRLLVDELSRKDNRRNDDLMIAYWNNDGVEKLYVAEECDGLARCLDRNTNRTHTLNLEKMNMWKKFVRIERLV